jgi:hypothetical protein
LLKNYLTKFDSKYNVLNILFCDKLLSFLSN